MCSTEAALGTPENTNICFQYLSHPRYTLHLSARQWVIICQKSIGGGGSGGGGGGDHPPC